MSAELRSSPHVTTMGKEDERPTREAEVESLKGKLLISSAALYDPNFRHTVVLIGEHDDSGAVGVILNRPLEPTVGEVAPTLSELVGADDRVYEGGPVARNQAVLLAEIATAGSIDVPVFGDVGFLTGEIPSEVRPSVTRARVFVGHAGWGAGQLEAEMAADSWIVEEATADDVFSPLATELWHRILERKGPPYDTLSLIPFDPSMN